MTRGARRLAASIAAALAVLLVAIGALAFTPPNLDGHVVDTAGALSVSDTRRLDQKLEAIRATRGYAIVVFVAGSLEGETIQDVAYKTFNTWTIGDKGHDDGVLLLIAPAERKIWIETGKGIGGSLTDLQADEIYREMRPIMQEGRVADAIDVATDRIASALAGESRTPAPRPFQKVDLIRIGAIGGGILLTIILAIVSPGFRMVLFFLLRMMLLGAFRGGGGGGGGGGSGGSGYSGGGGRSGGGGAGGDY